MLSVERDGMVARSCWRAGSPPLDGAEAADFRWRLVHREGCVQVASGRGGHGCRLQAQVFASGTCQGAASCASRVDFRRAGLLAAGLLLYGAGDGAGLAPPAPTVGCGGFWVLSQRIYVSSRVREVVSQYAV